MDGGRKGSTVAVANANKPLYAMCGRNAMKKHLPYLHIRKCVVFQQTSLELLFWMRMKILWLYQSYEIGSYFHLSAG